MYLFFIKLYASLMAGSWLPDTNAISTSLRTNSNYVFHNIFKFVLNALGGNYGEIQNFNIFESMQTITNLGENSHLVCFTASVLALITMVGVCLVVWKLTKAVFSIFFSRA